jgi:uncharacterized SAM-binding protein YcdF (DUF218 family)
VLIIIGAINILNFSSNAKPLRADCIIILGCKVDGTIPSPFLVSRLDEGIRIYKAGYGNYIIASGGQGPGESISEAAAMKRYIIAKGVASTKILMDEASTNTMTNLINSKKIMDENKFNTAIIVSNKSHLKRASLMARKLGITASYSGIYNSNYKSQELSVFLREIVANYRFYILGK